MASSSPEFNFADAQAWSVERSPAGDHRCDSPPGEWLSAAEYVERLRAQGREARRTRNGWMVSCPLHDDQVPSLHVSTSPKTGKLLLMCHGCGAEFLDLLAVVGVGPKADHSVSMVPSSCSAMRLHKLKKLHYLTNVCTTKHHDVGVIQILMPVMEHSQLRREALKCSWIEGEIFAPVWLPKRAGKVMRKVVWDLVDIARSRIRSGQPYAIAYGTESVAKRLSADGSRVHPDSVRNALRALCQHDSIRCVGQLPPKPGYADGAKLYALVVPCPACSGCVEAGPAVAVLDAELAPAVELTPVL